MIRNFAKNAEVGKLIVSGALLCVEPTGTAATLFGFDAAIEVRNKFFKERPELETLARELDAEFNAQLATKAYDKPADARQVLPDMLRIATADPSRLVDCDLDPDDVMREIKRALDAEPAASDVHRHDIRTAFTRLYGPLITKACNDPRLKAALDPKLYRKEREEQRKMARKVDDLHDHLLDDRRPEVSAIQKARDMEFSFLFAQVSANPNSPSDIGRLLSEMLQAGVSVDEVIALIPKEPKP